MNFPYILTLIIALKILCVNEIDAESYWSIDTQKTAQKGGFLAFSILFRSNLRLSGAPDSIWVLESSTFAKRRNRPISRPERTDCFLWNIPRPASASRALLRLSPCYWIYLRQAYACLRVPPTSLAWRAIVFVKLRIDVPTVRTDFPYTASSNALFVLRQTFFLNHFLYDAYYDLSSPSTYRISQSRFSWN